MSRPTYNERVSPTRRRRTGDPTLDAAVEAAGAAAGTAFVDLDEAAPSVPDEPAWMRDAPAATTDPTAPVPPPDPAAARRTPRRRARSRSSAPSTPSRPAP